MSLRELLQSVTAARRGMSLALNEGQLLLPTSEAVTRAVAFAAVYDEDYVAAHRRLLRSTPGTDEHAAAQAEAVRAYAVVARRISDRANALAKNGAACERIVAEARVEQHGEMLYYFGPYLIGLAVAIPIGLITWDPRRSGITFAIVWFAAVLIGAAVTRLRRRAFTNDVAQVMEPEVLR